MVALGLTVRHYLLGS